MYNKQKVQFKTVSLFQNIAKILMPPPKLLVSDWADTYRKLSPEASAEPGQWHTSRAEFQREIMNSVNSPEIQDVVIKSSAQVGKALDINTLIPTVCGWRTLKEINVGDKVFDKEGKTCTVTFVTDVMYGHKCYKITFSDNTEIIADAEHNWYVESDTPMKNGAYEGVITTKTIAETFKYREYRNRYAIPMNKPLDLPKQDLIIEPYMLGVWLGDGSSYSAQLTLNREDLVITEYIEKLGYSLVIREGISDSENAVNIIFNKVKNQTMYSLLKNINLIGNKHIPKLYLRASYNQRLELLQGLMDTDGHITKRGRCEITLKSYQLIQDVSELLYTLGIKHTLKKKYAICTNSRKQEPILVYRISFLAYSNQPVFKLSRKKNRMISGKGGRPSETLRRRITNVEAIESRPVKCITVDSPSHLYLAGKQMIPTHNTEILLNICGYFMDYEPTSIMLIQPTIDMGEAFSKDRLAPMIRDTDVLKAKVKEPRSKDSDNTILHKKFPGGHITISGANSPSSLASRPIRVLLCDEIDRYPASAGSEGDPVKLGEKRTTTFWNRKRIKVSTPTIEGISKIQKEFLKGTQEEWCVECPSCGKYQSYEFKRIQFDTVEMECIFCKEKFTEQEWKDQPHKWIASNPKAKGKRIRSFHLNELCSPWKHWDEIVDEFIDANNDLKKTGSSEALKVFINTSLGETWEEKGDGADAQDLLKRREDYDADLPDGVLLLTAGVDVQDDRLEFEVVGWSKGYESWGIYKKEIRSSPALDSTWERLVEELSEEYYFKNGNGLIVAATCIDTGGHHTNMVYKFVKKMSKMNKNIFGIKGYSDTPGIPLVYKKTKVDIKNSKDVVVDHTDIFILGVNSGKDDITSRLKIADKGPGYCHFPSNIDRGYNQTYMEGITSEEKVTKFVKNKPKIMWVKKSGVRNEPLDIRNYAYAAVEIIRPNWNILERKINDGINYMKSKANNNTKRKRGVGNKGVEV
jgi:phage terminase large subunit GpA-like protein|uniref:Terminase, large subunit n=1 Tax=Caudovirales sp. ctCiv1 TaxID=2826769 RepID=A0A8S5M8P7_9CAUD|nr:terminase gpA endonuclease subunit [uncultured Lachnoclostridium sp.]DAD78536.1 MAG TPA: terminase large subunit [Caudovirales sp. ctCiv1]